MKKVSKHYSIEMNSIDLDLKKGSKPTNYQKMEVEIHGTPSLPEIIHLMGDIKAIIKVTKGDYISVTDLTKLSINKFLGKIILSGMESAYKLALGVGRPSVISFVILGNGQEYAGVLSNTLQNINTQKIDTTKDYKYRYYFVEKREQIRAIAEQILT